MVTRKKSDGSATLSKEVQELRIAIEKSYRALRHYNMVRRSIAMSFLRGVVSALGAMCAVVIVTPLVILVLKSVAWPPLIADLVTMVIDQYQQVNPQSLRAADGQ